jgi:hypothetical protein
MRPRALVSLAAVAALLLSAGRASAERTWIFLRGGADLEGGPFIVPGSVTVGVVGPHFQVGIVGPGRFGLNAKVGFDWFVGGKVGGFYSSAALLAEVELVDRIWAGIGPDLGFDVVSPLLRKLVYKESRVLYGGRLQLRWSAIQWSTSDDGLAMLRKTGIGENMLSLSLGLRLLGRTDGFTGVWNPSRTASPSPIAIVPTVSFGYQGRAL